MAYFPMFVDLNQKPCLIIGGGKVAYRKVKVLLDFGAQIKVIAPEICSEIMELSGKLEISKAELEMEECHNKTLVIAATSNKELNHQIAEYCKEKNIPVNAVDQKEDCTFIFPSYVMEKDVVAAFSSAGKSPVITQYLKSREREILTSFIGELNDCLGKWRPAVQSYFKTEEERKTVYMEIMELGLCEGCVPQEDEIEEIINYRMSKAGL